MTIPKGQIFTKSSWPTICTGLLCFYRDPAYLGIGHFVVGSWNFLWHFSTLNLMLCLELIYSLTFFWLLLIFLQVIHSNTVLLVNRLIVLKSIHTFNDTKVNITSLPRTQKFILYSNNLLLVLNVIF